MTKGDLAKAARATAGKNAPKTLEKIAQEMNYVDLESLYAAIGEGQVSAESRGRSDRKGTDESSDRHLQTPVEPTRTRSRRDPGSVGVRVEGFDDVFVRLSRCCTPVPGDSIMGFVTRGRGVSVHRTDCSNAESLALAQVDRLIEVEWDDDGQADSFVVSVEVKAYDRSHLLADVYSAVSDQHINILSSASSTSDDHIARMTFEFEIVDLAHLDWLIRSIRQVDGAFDVYRVVPGQLR